MDRRAFKAAARQDVAAASYSPRRVTLVFLLLILTLAVMDVGVTYLIEHTVPSGHYLSDTISAGSRNYIMIVLFSLLCQAVYAMLMAGYTAFSLALIDREAFSLRILWEGFRRAGAVVALYLLRALFIGLWAGVLSIPASVLLTVLLPSLDPYSLEAYLLELGTAVLLMFILSYRYRTAFFLLMDDPGLTARQGPAPRKNHQPDPPGAAFFAGPEFSAVDASKRTDLRNPADLEAALHALHLRKRIPVYDER